MNKTIIFILALFLSFSARADGLTAKQIMEKNEEIRRLDDVKAEAVISTETVNKQKVRKQVKKFTFWKKIRDDKVHYNSLTRFHFPASIRNEGILFWEHNVDKTDIFLYLPMYKKIRRVEGSQQKGSFMGSAFSYSDITTPHVEDYIYKMRNQEVTCGHNEKEKCWVIEQIPINDNVKERTGYSLMVNWVSKTHNMVVKGEFFDLEGKLQKNLDSRQIKEVDTQKHKWMSHWIKMEDVSKNKTTELEFSSVLANKGIDESIFTKENLQREK